MTVTLMASGAGGEQDGRSASVQEALRTVISGGAVTDFAEYLNRPPEPLSPPARRYRGRAAPFDESPTVAILERWREVKGPNARRIPEQLNRASQVPRDDGGFAERFLRSRRYAARHTGDS